MKKVRVAALQFAAGIDTTANQQKILAMIDKAAVHFPDLMVLPEFANHASWYRDHEHCYEVSLPLDGAFIGEVAARARRHNAYIVLNVTLQREDKACTGSSILFSRKGEILAVSDKQVLMGHENDFLRKATQETPVVETEIGRIGLYACMDGVVAETPRGLALRGAQILCNSLNSFAVDEASLHVPVRAAENKVFVIASNKIGPLIPEDQLATASQWTGIPQHFLYGAGESQVVAPDGTVLVKASLANEEVIIAEIDPSLADDKTRPDGNCVFRHRRAELYAPLAEKPQPISHSTQVQKIRVACWQAKEQNIAAIDELVAMLPELSRSYDLVVVPELFFLGDLNQVAFGQALELSAMAIERIQRGLASSSLHVAGSFLVEVDGALQHCGMILTATGSILKQTQLHQSVRYREALQLGQEFIVVETAFGKVGVVVGEDAIYPEVFRIMALKGADLVAIPGHLQERWEVDTGLVERAAENRLCLAFATRSHAAGGSLLADLERDFTLLTPWEERIFDGKINMPKLRHAQRTPGITGGELNLPHTRNKVLSARTHLLNDRPWQLW